MIGEAGMSALLKEALACSTADQTQVVLIAGESALTRLAENTIHQNVAETESRLTVKAVHGKKVGSASGQDLTAAGLRETVLSACEIAQHSREDRQFVSLPEPDGKPYPAVASFHERTAEFAARPEARARAAAVLAAEAERAGFRAAGSVGVQVGELGIANSLGVLAYAPHSRVEASTVFMSGDSSGHAADTAVDVADVAFEELAAVAVNKCHRSRDAREVPPGDYEVILEPEAFGALLVFLIRVGFHHVLYRQGGSFLSRKLGRQVLGENITIWDDATDPRGLPIPFDFEGVRKRRLVLFENGVFRNMVYDSYTGGEAGRPSTGHAIPFSGLGAMPTNVFVQPGRAGYEEMIRSTRRGLLVTRFHYTNLVHPRRVVITGMTRDGTFLVENGELKGPVRNMRFTQSALAALRDVEMVGAATTIRRLGLANVPAVKLRRFAFTGATEY